MRSTDRRPYLRQVAGGAAEVRERVEECVLALGPPTVIAERDAALEEEAELGGLCGGHCGKNHNFQLTQR